MEDAKKNDTAEFVRKPINMRDLKEQYYGSFRRGFEVEKIAELSREQFERFSGELYGYYRFLYDNRDVMYMGPGDRNMHCILVTTSEYREGILVEAEGYAYPRYEQLTIFRRRNIGFVFQNYNLVPILNVYENIVLPVELDGDTVDKVFMNEVVRMLALSDKLDNMPNSLSGGQQQRVAIARALVSKPAIVLADEPTGNLDSRTSGDVLGLLKATSNKFNQTLVMITHNNEIAQLADRIIRIEDGRILE